MILEFSNPEQLKNWYETCPNVSPEKYIVYITAQKEIVFRPTKATDTYDIGYYKAIMQNLLDEMIKMLENEGYIVLKVKNIHWDKEKFNNVVLS